jgi:hypothetical protein
VTAVLLVQVLYPGINRFSAMTNNIELSCL